MIAEETKTPVEILQERVLKLEQELARVQEEFLSVKSSLVEVTTQAQKAETAPTRQERIAKAKGEIFTEYDYLLRELAK